MGAHPKRKISSHRQGKRRAHFKLNSPHPIRCRHCGAPKLSHYRCPECGKI
ncbi:MAG: 50S ribosomal protein L32 [Candidatus Chisholmbacteria bacterium]|nr:50S ribosomal protein L32 [Candidatus Chisholmbacteria bacterium]